jgi:hypothetical protein
MPKGIQHLFKYWGDKAEYSFLPELLETSLFFNCSAAMQMKNARLIRQTNHGVKKIIPVFYSIIMAEPGAGKDFSMELTAEPFYKAFDNFVDRIDSFVSHPNNRNEKNELAIQYIKMSSHLITVTGTTQGMQQAAQTITDLGFGSVNIFTSEIGNHIMNMEPVMTKLKQAFDKGEFQGDLISSGGGEKYFTVKNVACNALLMGSPGIFLVDPKLKQALHMHLISGMARRSFVYFNTTYRKSENRNKYHETMSEEDIKIAHSYMDELLSHIRDLEMIDFPQKIKEKLTQYDISKEIIRENSASAISSELGSPRKIERLAAIIAVLDLSYTVTEEHLKYAIDYSERVDATAEEAVRVRGPYEQIYDILAQRGFISRTELMREIKGLTMRNLDDEVTLARELASQLGNSIVTKEYSGIIKYKLERLTATKLDRIILSINENSSKTNPDGFKKVEGNWEDIHKVLISPKRYSAGTFLNDYIKDDNYLSEQNIIIIDVDDGMTIEEAKGLFKYVVHVIATTKSHQIQKGKKEAVDRFRLVLPTISKFHLKPAVYSEMYKNLMEALGMDAADISCRNVSRWFYGFKDGEYWYNDNPDAELLDIRPFIPDTSENKDGEKNIMKVEAEWNNSYNEFDEAERRKAGMKRWLYNRTNVGNRNQMVFQFGAFIKDLGGDVETEVKEFNSKLGDSLPDREIGSIIRSVLRR